MLFSLFWHVQQWVSQPLCNNIFVRGQSMETSPRHGAIFAVQCVYYAVKKENKVKIKKGEGRKRKKGVLNWMKVDL